VLQGLSPNTYSEEPDPIDEAPIADNISRTVVKAALPRVLKSKPRPMFETIAGDWSQRTKARKLERVVNGHIYRLQLYRKNRKLVRDAEIFGTMGWRYYELDGEPAADRVFPWQIVVDPRESYFGEPRCLYYWQYIDRAVLQERYPMLRDEIADLKAERDSADEWSQNDNSDMLLVWHAWHLPSGKDADDGLYAVAVGDLLLEHEQWEDPTFPFAFYLWDEPIWGIYGEGLVRDVIGHQYELGAVTRVIRIALRAGVPRTYIPQGSNINPADLDDRPGTNVVFTGQQLPVLLSPPPISDAYFNWRNQVRVDGLQETGTSQTSAYSKKDPSIHSARGQQLMEDIEDTRFLGPAEAYDQLMIDSSYQIVRLCKRIAKSHQGEQYKVLGYDVARKRWAQMKWDEVDLDASAYYLRVYPVSQLPSTPAGKSDLVDSWFQSGVIDADERRMMLELPDVEAYGGLRNAAYDYVSMQLEAMLFDGKTETPDPTVSWEMPLKLGRLYYVAALRDGAPEKHLKLVRTYLVKAEKMKQDAMKPPAQPNGPAMGPGPGAALPMPGPTPDQALAMAPEAAAAQAQLAAAGGM
jgi:hypothetical protein